MVEQFVICGSVASRERLVFFLLKQLPFFSPNERASHVGRRVELVPRTGGGLWSVGFSSSVVYGCRPTFIISMMEVLRQFFPGEENVVVFFQPTELSLHVESFFCIGYGKELAFHPFMSARV